MKTALSSFIIFFLFAGGHPLPAQENTTPADFGLPGNTLTAFEIKGFYNPQDGKLKQSGSWQYQFTATGLLTVLKEQITEGFIKQIRYYYDSSRNLTQADHLLGTISGPLVWKSAYFTRTENNITTRIQKEQNGDTLKILEFRNEAGELRGKTFFDEHGNKVKVIEYGGEKEYRTRTYKKGLLASDVLYIINEQGKISKTITYTVSGKEKPKEALTTFVYNEKGDLLKRIKHYPADPGNELKVMNTDVVEYLYDGEIWVASIEYQDRAYRPAENLKATVRRIGTGGKMYTARGEQEILQFFKQAYEQHLKSAGK